MIPNALSWLPMVSASQNDDMEAENDTLDALTFHMTAIEIDNDFKAHL